MALRDRRTPVGPHHRPVRRFSSRDGHVAGAADRPVPAICRSCRDPVTIDLRHLSLHPWGDGSRIALARRAPRHTPGGVVGRNADSIGGALALEVRGVELSHSGWSCSASGSAPAAIAASLAFARGWPFSGLGLILAAATCGSRCASGPADRHLVPPNDRRFQDSRVVRGLSAPGAAPLSSARFLRRSCDPPTDNRAICGAGARRTRKRFRR